MTPKLPNDANKSRREKERSTRCWPLPSEGLYEANHNQRFPLRGVAERTQTNAQPPACAPTASASLLSCDELARADAARGLEGAAAISRRVGAGLLRRAAERATAASDLPAPARDALAGPPKAHADALELKQ